MVQSSALLPSVLCVAATVCGCQAADDQGPADADATLDRGETPTLDAAEAAAEAAGDPLVGGSWRLVAFQDQQRAEEPIDSDPPYTIEFTADGRVAGAAHCNRYSGDYEHGGAGRLSIGPVGATRAMCAPPSRSSEFLRAIEGIEQYEIEGGSLRLTFGTGGVLTFSRPAPVSADAAPEVGRTFVFDCTGEISFTVRTGPGEAALWIPPALGGQYLVLAATPAASGARYQEDETVFWNRGEVASFEVAGQRFADCRSNPSKVPWADAARRGATFRAVGHEPEWSLEVLPGGRLVLVTELGAQRTETSDPEPTVEGSRTTYRASTDAQDLVVVVDRVGCVDTMSGEALDAAVTITFEGRTLEGCGRSL
jgi:heat shock protein HslJ/uncharacterized membrane protein